MRHGLYTGKNWQGNQVSCFKDYILGKMLIADFSFLIYRTVIYQSGYNS